MNEWASLELAPWRGVAIAPDELLRRQLAACDTSPTLRLFTIKDGVVGIDERTRRDHPAPEAADLVRRRAALYLGFLQEVVSRYKISGRCRLATLLGDKGPEYRTVPLFAFQKVRASTTLLLPDVDVLSSGYFRDEALIDAVPFDDKQAEAIFVGATTGAQVTANITGTRNQRLAAALHFRDHPHVHIELPSVVQCDTPETKAAVERLNLGRGWRSWQDQFAYRYIVSMDGNGATCSRVAIALKSNSALVKYNSAHMLYYFRGLTPWIHYIPMRRHLHLEQLVEHAGATIERDRAIAEAGTAFADAHLTRDAVMAYTEALLRGYIALFGY